MPQNKTKRHICLHFAAMAGLSGNPPEISRRPGLVSAKLPCPHTALTQPTAAASEHRTSSVPRSASAGSKKQDLNNRAFSTKQGLQHAVQHGLTLFEACCELSPACRQSRLPGNGSRSDLAPILHTSSSPRRVMMWIARRA